MATFGAHLARIWGAWAETALPTTTEPGIGCQLFASGGEEVHSDDLRARCLTAEAVGHPVRCAGVWMAAPDPLPRHLHDDTARLGTPAALQRHGTVVAGPTRVAAGV